MVRTVPQPISRRRVLLRIALFLLSAALILVAFNTLASVSNILRRLSVVERDRDLWQRPSDVIQSLAVRDGIAVVDLGSGAGYFTLKLSAAVGRRGEVHAVDLRRLSLFFLRLRALLQGLDNIDITVGTPDDPHLRAGRADAVLISNTYHEFDNPRSMLDHIWQALRPGGRLVIVDRRPRSGQEIEAPGSIALAHEVPPAVVEAELLQTGFEILSRDDRFIDRPDDNPWWMLVARRP